MYWPIGTPRAYATTSNPGTSTVSVSDDDSPDIAGGSASEQGNSTPASLRFTAPRPDDAEELAPKPPLTPAIRLEEEGDAGGDMQSSFPTLDDVASATGAREPILALKVSRSGHIFAAITSRTITVWQTRPVVVVALVIRSKSSLETYGKNIDLLLRPDNSIFVVQTSLGYLITYSMVTDPDSQVYRPHFPSYNNVQKRRQNHTGGPGAHAPDQFLWGPGEGMGVKDTNVRFRMVIKVDAGIESVIALDDELVVSTHKPPAIQCIRWAPDAGGKHTRTEILSRMGWLDKKSTVAHMTYDRPMNLMTWVTGDGRAYAVQQISSHGTASTPTDPETKKIFRGHCFHDHESRSACAIQAVINARFSLIAVGCADGVVQVYSVKDYSGNIPHSHTHTLPVSSTVTGRLEVMAYSPDGYCLFVGYENGWATWSVYGKVGSHSFNIDSSATRSADDGWLGGINNASWVGGSSELLMASRQSDTIWALEMSRSAVSSCYTSSNIFRTVLQSSTDVSVYRGYDLPDLTSISAEPFLWHTTKVPSIYLWNQWPIRCTVISPDGRYVAVAGRRGLAHYSVNSGRWKSFTDPEMENEFQVRGGMCWYQHILVAAVEVDKSYELRLFSRETALDNSQVLHIQQIPAPIVLVTTSEEDSVLVYTHSNILYHFIITPVSGSIGLVQVGQIAFHGIIRSPARVRGLSWILPERHLAEGDPSQDVTVASVLFVVDGKLVMLCPTMSGGGHLRYEMRVVAQNVEFHANMRDEPFSMLSQQDHDQVDSPRPTMNEGNLRTSLWVYDGNGLKTWPDIQDVLQTVSAEHSRSLPSSIYIPTDFYPLSILLDKGIVLGVESDLIQRRDVSFSYFRFNIRTHLFLSDIIRFYLVQGRKTEALQLARNYQGLVYLPHALEVLLHNVLDEEVDASPKPEDAILPRVLSLLSSFKEYLDIVLQCTRKTDVRQWKTLFAYLPPVQELFEESLQRGSLKTAGGYLLILHTLEEAESVSEQSMRLFSRAIREGDWELCKELARFLAALDESGATLRSALELVNAPLVKNGASDDMLTRLGLPSPRSNGVGGGGSAEALGASDDGSPTMPSAL